MSRESTGRLAAAIAVARAFGLDGPLVAEAEQRLQKNLGKFLPKPLNSADLAYDVLSGGREDLPEPKEPAMASITATDLIVRIETFVLNKKNQVEAARTAITEAVAEAVAGEYLVAERIGKLANTLAEDEAGWNTALVLQRAAVTAQREGRDAKEALLRAITEIMLQGPDDTWSGRGNDIKRAAFDGRRAVAEKVMDLVVYGH